MSVVTRWGNSLAVRIPKSVVDSCALKLGTRVIIRSLDNGSVLITPANGPIVVQAASLAKSTKPEPVW